MKNSTELPSVSVIIPFYNDERFIAMCIESVQNQDEVNWEIVAVDDRGTDDSAEIVASFMGIDERVRLVRHDQNRGLAASRNTGVAFARGDAVVFLDADDFVFPMSLHSRAVELAKLSWPLSVIAGSYAGWEMVPEEAELSYRPTGSAKMYRLTYENSHGENPLIATAPMLWRDTVLDVGGFDESFSTAEDFEFWMRLLRQGYILVPTGEIGVAYRQKRSGMISDGLARHASNAGRVYEYIHRRLEDDGVSVSAPAPVRRSLSDHQRVGMWLLRIMQFLVVAVAAEDDNEVAGLLELLPEDVGMDDLQMANLRKSARSGLARFELRRGDLPEARRTELEDLALDVLIVEVAARTSPNSQTQPGLFFPLSEVRDRAEEVVIP